MAANPTVRRAAYVSTDAIGSAEGRLIGSLMYVGATVAAGASVASGGVLAKNGRLVASRVFLQSRKLDKVDPLSAVAAFNDAFDSVATELITWTADAL